jgi:methyl-accepting chemotaxis protein
VLFKKRKDSAQSNNYNAFVEDTQKTATVSETNDNSNTIKQYLNTLINNDLTTLPPADDEISTLIRTLAEKMQAHILSEMTRCVQLSIEANESAIFSAQMLLNLREVDAQTQSIAAAAEEMVATVKEIERYGMGIADQAQEAQNAVQSGADDVGQAAHSMNNITTAVNEGVAQVNTLAEFTQKIGGIADDIKKIAEQTNLLALNATIEAARAGDAGKGFAVVASEVKTLANQTAKSTEEITNIITNLQDEMKNVLKSMENSTKAVNDGQSAMAQVNERMQEISEKINVVTGNTSQISSTLQEQNQASSEVAQGIATIAANSTKSVDDIGLIVNSMDNLEKHISGQITDLADFDVPGKVIKLAQSDHVIWKKRLANMVAGREGLNADELADHHSCRLGKWYDNVTEERYLNNPIFKELLKPHELVHKHGIEAVRLYNDKKTKEAIAEVAKVEEASKDVLRLLAELEKDTAA